MKKIYKISIASILLALAFLTLNAAAIMKVIPDICVCGCYNVCTCGTSCLEECLCHFWN